MVSYFKIIRTTYVVYKWMKLYDGLLLIIVKLKLDESGNKVLFLVCIGNFLLLLFFQYLIEIIILKKI